MSEYDLRSAFPLSGREFTAHARTWICRLAEVSDLRPDEDRLSWYLVFQTETSNPQTRKLEIVTSAAHLLSSGFGEDLPDRLFNWLMTDEQDGRLEWLDC